MSMALTTLVIGLALAAQGEDFTPSGTKFLHQNGLSEERDLLGNVKNRTNGSQSKYPDPKNCLVVLDGMGHVGLRIADSQALVDTTRTALNARLGRNGEVVWQGAYDAAKKMGRLSHVGNESREEKMDYLKEAMVHAKFRIRVRFKKKRSGTEITLTCRKAGAPAKKVLEKKVIKAKRFSDARDQLEKAVAGICIEMNPPRKAHVMQRADGRKLWERRKKRKDDFVLPPRR